jgi:CheY-like chemotaxis protein
MVSFTLKGAGYEVVEAADGVEALDIAKGRPVNLVITEVVADTSPVKQDSMSEGEVELF